MQLFVQNKSDAKKEAHFVLYDSCDFREEVRLVKIQLKNCNTVGGGLKDCHGLGLLHKTTAEKLEESI